MEMDEAGKLASRARQCVDDQQYAKAADLFSQALAALPGDRVVDSRRFRLEKAKACMLGQQLPAAYDELTVLLDELEDDKSVDPVMLADTQNSLAAAKYYLTWLMRLEGEPRQAWEPEIEGSRQLYRLLAEKAAEQGDEDVARKHREDLEAAVRLARLDLSELQALPLPSQCKGCCSGQCQCKGKGKCKGQGKGMNKPQGKDDSRGASSGPPPDGKGN
jgi:hypothetical protein